MKMLDDLRPDVRPLDPQWSAQTLAAILSEPVPVPVRQRPRRLAVAAVAALGVLGAGGAAVAGGWVPESILAAFEDLDEHSQEAFDVSGVRPIADFMIPDGTRYTVWRGMNAAGGSCEAIREDRPDNPDDGLSIGCFSGDSADRYEALRFGWVQLPEAEGQQQNPMYYLAYGESPSDDATSVEIVGDGTEVVLPIDPVTRGFGGNLPDYQASGGLPDLTFTFRDAAGNVVASESPWR